MGVFKEEVIFLENLAKRQKPIWDDACDAGINFDDMQPAEVDRMRDTIKTLLALPGSEIIWRSDKPATQRQYRLVVMWGRAHEQLYDATVVEVLYYKGQGKHFFSINPVQCLVDREGGVA